MPKTFPPLPKAVPLGKVASPQAMTEGVSPQRRAFAESGAANAAAIHDPTREKGIQIKIPSQWSISCWMICAVQPVKVLMRSLPSMVWYCTLMLW